MQDIRKEKQTVTSKKHDKRCVLPKTEENEAIMKLQNLQKQHDYLVEENKKNLISIKELKDKIASMETAINTVTLRLMKLIHKIISPLESVEE